MYSTFKSAIRFVLIECGSKKEFDKTVREEIKPSGLVLSIEVSAIEL